jgi:hypothetical protein
MVMVTSTNTRTNWVHPLHGIPRNIYGSFSFFGCSKPLYYIWMVPHSPFPITAWINLSVLGVASITFHPCLQQNNTITILLSHKYIVPPAHWFRVYHHTGDTWNLLLPITNGEYSLYFYQKHLFYILNIPWEEWSPQVQAYHRAFNNTNNHNTNTHIIVVNG